MIRTIWLGLLASIAAVMVVVLSIGTLSARDADLASRTFAATQTAKQQCLNTCRARYRDCRRLNQVPSFECRGVYQDCTRYTCTGLGPGQPNVPFAAVSGDTTTRSLHPSRLC